MALSSVWSRLTGGIFGVGIGVAAADAMAPVLEPARQEAWQANQHRVLTINEVAQLVAQAVIDVGSADAEAARNGYDSSRVAAVVQGFLEAPGMGELLRMARRGTITPAHFDHGLRKHKLEALWDAPLAELESERLDPSTVATAIQRGILADPGILPVPPPVGGGTVPPMPQEPIDPVAEAAAAGENVHRLGVRTKIVGLPPAPGELLDLVNRGVIDTTDFARGVAEGNTRNEWGPFLLQLRHRLVTPEQAATLRLKGWIDQATSHQLGALRGASPQVMDYLYLAGGRPAAPVQMFTAWARGIDGPDGVPMNKAQFDKGIVESDIRPEWATMLWGIRYAYPSLFQLRHAVQDGSITPARALTILQYERYEDQDAQALVSSWAKGGGGATKALTAAQLQTEYDGLYIDRATFVNDLEALGYLPADANAYADLADARRVKAARDAVVSRIKGSYVGHKITLPEATADLAATGIPQAAQDLLLQQWQLEYDAYVVVLSAAQVKKAYKKGIFDQQTALDRLVGLGWVLADAQTYLAEG